MPAPSRSSDPSTYFALIEVSSLLRHAVEQQLREAGDLSAVQFQLLARLGDSPGGSVRMTDLADGIVYSRSGLTYQAQALERRGLIARAPSPEDERATTVTITQDGRDLLAAVLPGHTAALETLLLDALTPDDVESLGALLGRLRDQLRAAPPRSAAPRSRRSS